MRLQPLTSPAVAASLTILLLGFVLVVLPGCGLEPAQVALAQQKKTETKAKCERITAKTDRIIKNFFGPTKEFRVIFQDELKGITGQLHGSFGGSLHGGFGGGGSVSGSIDGSTENAKSDIITWMDRQGSIYQNSIPERKIRFNIRENKPASIRFYLDLSAPIPIQKAEAEIEEIADVTLQSNGTDEYDRSGEGNYELATTVEWCMGPYGEWTNVIANPGQAVASHLKYAILYASRRELKLYYGFTAP